MARRRPPIPAPRKRPEPSEAQLAELFRENRQKVLLALKRAPGDRGTS